MDFIEANKSVLLEKYATFSGRAPRSEFWWFFLGYIIGYIILMVVDPSGLLSGIFCLAILIPSIAVAIRRLHDIDMSGWWYLLMIIPLVNLLFLLFMGLKAGTPGSNRFGANPLGA